MQLTWGVGLEDVLKTLSIHLCLSGHTPPAAAFPLRPGSWPLHRVPLGAVGSGRRTRLAIYETNT